MDQNPGSFRPTLSLKKEMSDEGVETWIRQLNMQQLNVNNMMS